MVGTVLVHPAVRHPDHVRLGEVRLETGLDVEPVLEEFDLHVLVHAGLPGGQPVVLTGHERVVEDTVLPEREHVGDIGLPPAPPAALSPESGLVEQPRPLSLPPLETATVHHGAANPLDQHSAIVRRPEWRGSRS